METRQLIIILTFLVLGALALLGTIYSSETEDIIISSGEYSETNSASLPLDE